MKKVLLTGAAGYIGKAFVHRYGQILEIRGYTRTIGDIRDKHKVIKASAGSEAIVHAAAITTDRPWVSEKELLEVNVEGTRNVLEAAVKNQIGKVVFVSSVCAVGFRQGNLPIREDEECRPTDGVYGASKFQAEALCKHYSKQFGLRVICLRPAIVIPQHEFIRPAVDSIPWISYVHIDDVLAAIKLALDNQGINFGVFHVAPDNKYSTFDITQAKSILNYHPIHNFREYTRISYFRLLKRRIRDLVGERR